MKHFQHTGSLLVDAFECNEVLGKDSDCSTVA